MTDTLVAANAPLWRAATAHRFVRELGGDTLPDAAFRRYLVQDFAFIEALVTLLGYAVARAPDMPAKRRLAGFLTAVTGDETNYFERALTALGAGEAFAAPDRIALGAATERFRALMAAAGERGTYAEILAIVTPAEWVYLEWARASPMPGPKRFYLKEWIELHALPAFADFVAWLRSELDREGAAAPPPMRQRLATLFRTTLELERDFFEAAYSGQEP
ncbi:MAG TPA: TenA family protein [Alphaproteobacteria bacterium]|jgi:thiaminase/transcriptional activator TenA